MPPPPPRSADWPGGGGEARRPPSFPRPCRPAGLPRALCTCLGAGSALQAGRGALHVLSDTPAVLREAASLPGASAPLARRRWTPGPRPKSLAGAQRERRKPQGSLKGPFSAGARTRQGGGTWQHLRVGEAWTPFLPRGNATGSEPNRSIRAPQAPLPGSHTASLEASLGSTRDKSPPSCGTCQSEVAGS